MWNDEEDNNPYGTSFDRRDSQTSSSVNPTSPTTRDCKFLSECDTQSQCIKSPLRKFVVMASLLTAHSTVNSYESAATPSASDDEAPAFGQSTTIGEHETPDTTQDEAPPKRKPGGYSSRIEQIVYENPNMQIIITDAGKSLESGGRHIVYTIRTGVCIAMDASEGPG